MMLPSGIDTELGQVLGDHPALAFISVHVAPLSVDRHTSFLKAATSPPINTILPSGIATLLCEHRADHSAPAFINVHVAPLSVERHTSFKELYIH